MTKHHSLFDLEHSSSNNRAKQIISKSRNPSFLHISAGQLVEDQNWKGYSPFISF